jgi:hypothetical protein
VDGRFLLDDTGLPDSGTGLHVARHHIKALDEDPVAFQVLPVDAARLPLFLAGDYQDVVAAFDIH